MSRDVSAFCSCREGGRGADRSAGSAAPAPAWYELPGTANPSAKGVVVGDALWLGPQIVLEGRPPALMEAGVG